MEAQAKAGCGANSTEHSYSKASDTVRCAVNWLSTVLVKDQSFVIRRIGDPAFSARPGRRPRGSCQKDAAHRHCASDELNVATAPGLNWVNALSCSTH